LNFGGERGGINCRLKEGGGVITGNRADRMREIGALSIFQFIEKLGKY